MKNKSKYKISIIIPLYNKQKTIEKCLSSIQNQSFKKFEVLVIDDGSTDNSGIIAKRFCDTDTRFLFFTQKNMGVSAARNLGLINARGKYVFFIDADDYIDSNYIEKYYKYNQFDLVMGGYELIKNKHILEIIKPKNQVISIKNWDVFFNEEMLCFIVMPWAKMYNLDIIKKNNIFFDNNTDYGEDTIFVFEYLKHLNSIKKISYSGYKNVIFSNTLSRKKRKNIWKINKYLVNALNKVTDYKYNENWTLMFVRAINISLRNGFDKKKDFYKTWNEIRKDPEFSCLKAKNIIGTHKKILYLLLKINFRFFSFLFLKIKYRKLQ